MSDREILKQATMMRVAGEFAKLSTCARNAVGAVITKDKRIIATGYNGAPARMPHCDHTCDCARRGAAPLCSEGCPNKMMRGHGPHSSTCAFNIWMDTPHHAPECRRQAPCTTAIHAEANAIADAARRGIAISGAELYVTLSPCLACAQLIVSSGISVVWFLKGYRDLTPLEYIQEAGVAWIGNR